MAKKWLFYARFGMEVGNTQTTNEAEFSIFLKKGPFNKYVTARGWVEGNQGVGGVRPVT